MSGLYDQLMNQLGDDDDKPAGLTPLDIADLPAGQRQVMFTMLRSTEGATDGLTLDDLQRKLPSVERLSNVLLELTQNGWLILRGEPPTARYKVNLRPRRGRKVSADIWASLAGHLAESAPDEFDDDYDADSGDSRPHLPQVSDW